MNVGFILLDLIKICLSTHISSCYILRKFSMKAIMVVDDLTVDLTVDFGHTMLITPLLVRSPKLSDVGFA